MNKLIKGLDKVLSVWCFSLMGILTFCIIATVFLRYVFNITFVRAEEAITMIFVATTFFGASLGIREKDHISIAFLSDISGRLVKKILVILVHLVIIFVMVMLYKYSVIWIQKVGAVPTPAMQIPSKYFYIIVPITSILAILYSLLNIVAEFYHIDEPDYGYEREVIKIEEELIDELGEENK